MRAKYDAPRSTTCALSRGFLCGLLLYPVGGLVVHALVLAYRHTRKVSLSPGAPAPLVRTEHGMRISPIPHSLGEKKRSFGHARLALRHTPAGPLPIPTNGREVVRR